MHRRLSPQSGSMISVSDSIISGGTFIQNTHWHSHGFCSQHTVQGSQRFDILKAAVAPSAFHNSSHRFDPPKCYPNTRVAVIQKILDWILSCNDETSHNLIMWLNGAAGAGKSAIAQTITELCYTRGLLLACFFFNKSDPTRNNNSHLVATLAYQLCLNLPFLREYIVTKIEADPLIFSRSFHEQLMQLVVDPFQLCSHRSRISTATNFPRLIVLDGLDECIQRSNQEDIVKNITYIMQNFDLPIRILVASRPEHDISTSFHSTGVSTLLMKMTLDDSYLPSADIETYICGKILEIKKTHPLKSSIPDSWPHTDFVMKITKKASGQFIYAATAVKYISSIRHLPHHRLDVVLQIKPPKDSEDLPFAELDALYRDILSSTEDVTKVLNVLSTFFILRDNAPGPPSVREMEILLSMEPGGIELILCDLGSLIEIKAVAGSDYKFIELSHLSLQDFLYDPMRSTHLHIDHDSSLARFTSNCVRLLITTSDRLSQTYFHDPDYGEIEYYWLALHSSLRAILNYDLRLIFPLIASENASNFSSINAKLYAHSFWMVLQLIFDNIHKETMVKEKNSTLKSIQRTHFWEDLGHLVQVFILKLTQS